MKSISRMTRTIGLSLALLMGLNTVAVPKAHALLIVEAARPWAHRAIFTDAVLCLVLLPFCILDKKVDGTPAMTSQDLIDNGYTAAEAQQIVSDSAALTAALDAQGKLLTVASSDTQASIAQDIRTVLPSASDTFVEFYASEAAAK